MAYGRAMTEANAEQRAYWNRDEARHWVDQQRRYDEMLEPFAAAVLDASPGDVLMLGVVPGWVGLAASLAGADSMRSASVSIGTPSLGGG